MGNIVFYSMFIEWEKQMKCINCIFFVSCKEADENKQECFKYINKRESRERQEYLLDLKKQVKEMLED